MHVFFVAPITHLAWEQIIDHPWCWRFLSFHHENSIGQMYLNGGLFFDETIVLFSEVLNMVCFQYRKIYVLTCSVIKRR